MKNSITYIIELTICFYLQSLDCKAQIIDNKVNIYAEYITGSFCGKELITEKNFIYPSMYNNLKNLSGKSLKVLCKRGQYLSWGINLTLLQASNWMYSDRTDYHDSKIAMQSISPIIQIHSKYTESKISNRGKVFIEINPVIGISKLSLTNSLFNFQSTNNPISPPVLSSDLFYGIKGNAGLEWGFTQYFAVIIAYSLHHNWVTSILYNDTQFTVSQFNIGIVLKFIKDKRFFYR